MSISSMRWRLASALIAAGSAAAAMLSEEASAAARLVRGRSRRQRGVPGWRGVAMPGLMRRAAVVAGSAVVLLGPAVRVASAAGGAAAGTRPATATRAVSSVHLAWSQPGSRQGAVAVLSVSNLGGGMRSTSGMAYHEGLWTATAAIGPIVALTSAIAYSRVLRLFTINGRKVPSGLRTGHAVGMAAAAYLTAFFSFAATVSVTLISLRVLATGRSQADQADMIWLLAFAFGLLLIQAILETRARYLMEPPRETTEPSARSIEH
jgi:hypothetical protein